MKTKILNRIYQALAVSAMGLLIAASPNTTDVSPVVNSTNVYSEVIVKQVDVPEVKASIEAVEVPVVTSYIEEEPELSLSEEEIELIALVTMAEAEGECEEGKRLVIDTILNRVDHDRFPDTVSEVIYQKSQFTSMWNGRVDKCYVDDDIYNLVVEELQSRTNYDIVFFTAGHYGKYGTPMFSVGNHYFASY